MEVKIKETLKLKKGTKLWTTYESGAEKWKSIEIMEVKIFEKGKLGETMVEMPGSSILPLNGRNYRIFTTKEEAIENIQKTVQSW